MNEKFNFKNARLHVKGHTAYKISLDGSAAAKSQPTSLPCPWDFPGKNTGVGCHLLLQCMKVKSESEVAQSCLDS